MKQTGKWAWLKVKQYTRTYIRFVINQPLTYLVTLPKSTFTTPQPAVDCKVHHLRIKLPVYISNTLLCQWFENVRAEVYQGPGRRREGLIKIGRRAWYIGSSFNKQALSTCLVLGTALKAGDTDMAKIQPPPASRSSQSGLGDPRAFGGNTSGVVWLEFTGHMRMGDCKAKRRCSVVNTYWRALYSIYFVFCWNTNNICLL